MIACGSCAHFCMHATVEGPAVTAVCGRGPVPVRVGGVSVDGLCLCLSKGHGVMATAGAGHTDGHAWEGADWRRAAACGESGCVEVARTTDLVAVRDGKNPHGPALVFTADEWRTFLDGAKSGDFD